MVTVSLLVYIQIADGTQLISAEADYRFTINFFLENMYSLRLLLFLGMLCFKLIWTKTTTFYQIRLHFLKLFQIQINASVTAPTGVKNVFFYSD